MSRSVALLWGAALWWGTSHAAFAGPPFAVGGDPSVEAGDYQVTAFAAGLDRPFGLEVLPDGSLYVGINPGASFFGASGAVLHLVDADDDGVADGPGTVVYSGLPGYILAVRVAGDLVFASVNVTSGAHSLYVLRQGATPASALTLEGTLDLSYPLPWQHATFNIDVREAPGHPGEYEVYFNVGSKENDAPTADSVSVTGLLTTSVNGDALYRVIVDDNGPSLVATGLVQIATGLRNAFGTAFDPDTGDLYIQDNGIDGLVDPNEPLSADELNVIAAADIGGAVEDFGFPDRYVEYRTGTLVGSGGIDPVVAYQPVPPPDGAESEGAVDVVFAPPLFPEALRGGVFVGFHGRFNLGGVDNEENPVVFTGLGTASHFHFISNTEPGLGHPDTLASTGDRLYVADLAASGELSSAGTGAVYRIRYQKKAKLPALSVGGVARLIVLLLLCGAAGLGRVRPSGV